MKIFLTFVLTIVLAEVSAQNSTEVEPIDVLAALSAQKITEVEPIDVLAEISAQKITEVEPIDVLAEVSAQKITEVEPIDVLAEVPAQNSTEVEVTDPPEAPEAPEAVYMHFGMHAYLKSRMKQSGVKNLWVVKNLEPQVKHLALLRRNLTSYVKDYKENNEFRLMVLEYVKNLPKIDVFKWNLADLSAKLDKYLMHISLEDAVKYMEGLFDGFFNVPHLKRIRMCRGISKQECSLVYSLYTRTLVSKDRHPILGRYPWMFYEKIYEAPKY